MDDDKNKITKSTSQHFSYNYGVQGGEFVSPVIGNQSYMTYRSPSEKVTGFDAQPLSSVMEYSNVNKDILAQYNPTTTATNNIISK